MASIRTVHKSLLCVLWFESQQGVKDLNAHGQLRNTTCRRASDTALSTMADVARSLRPRAAVDYAPRHAVAHTPDWLTKSRSRLSLDPALASKENQPAQEQPVGKKLTKDKKRRESEPPGAAAVSSPQKRQRKGKSEQATTARAAKVRGASSTETHSTRSHRSAGQVAERQKAIDDTAAQNISSPRQEPPLAAGEQPRDPQSSDRLGEAAEVEAPDESKHHGKKASKAPAGNNRKKAAKSGRKDSSLAHELSETTEAAAEQPASDKQPEQVVQEHASTDEQEQHANSRRAGVPEQPVTAEEPAAASQQPPSFPCADLPAPYPATAAPLLQNFLNLQVRERTHKLAVNLAAFSIYLQGNCKNH